MHSIGVAEIKIYSFIRAEVGQAVNQAGAEEDTKTLSGK
jgi:hypothetical protein